MGVRLCGVAFALCVIVGSRPVSAQETINSASVSGRVTYTQGAVVPGAQVTARETETNVTRETVTDQEGRFRLPYLKVGRYEITVRLQGFADVTRVLTLTVGSAFELPVSLKLGTVDTNVTVSAEATVLEAARSQIAGTVSQTEVRNLPMNGRNFLDLALLVPGVSPTNVASTPLFAAPSAVPGGGLSVGSQRTLSNHSSSPAFRPTTLQRHLAEFPSESTLSISSRSSRRAARRSSGAPSAATSTS